MFVRDVMSSPVVTIPPDMPFQEALRLMQERKFQRLPVVDAKGKLVGIVAERDLLYASPSPATSLSVWEMNYMLSKIKIERLMTREVITTTPDTVLEAAAHLMVVHRISGLPVLEGGQVVGIITETDIFRTMVAMFGGGQSGLRLTLEVPKGKGVLAKISQAIFELDGEILSIGSFPLKSEPLEDGLVMKVRDVSKEQLIDTLEALGDHVIDAQEV
jgi:acetoin utilization protein AcuB